MSFMEENVKDKQMAKFEDKIIEVCDNCFQACCWYGEFMCNKARSSGTILKTISELRKLQDVSNIYESEEYWSDEYMNAIYGDPAPHGYK